VSEDTLHSSPGIFDQKRDCPQPINTVIALPNSLPMMTCLFVCSVLIPRHKVDGSAVSKQLPSLILYEGGKETKRRPLVDRRGVITKYTFTEVRSST